MKTPDCHQRSRKASRPGAPQFSADVRAELALAVVTRARRKDKPKMYYLGTGSNLAFRYSLVANAYA